MSLVIVPAKKMYMGIVNKIEKIINFIKLLIANVLQISQQIIKFKMAKIIFKCLRKYTDELLTSWLLKNEFANALIE